MAPEHASIRRVVVIYNPRSGSLLAAGDDDPEAALRKLFALGFADAFRLRKDA